MEKSAMYNYVLVSCFMPLPGIGVMRYDNPSLELFLWIFQYHLAIIFITRSKSVLLLKVTK